ncbi:MAG: deoxyguanosinetriphosphate triphosphohydrolase [Pseudomonadota bacterium]
MTLNPYACMPEQSRGRQFDEQGSLHRSHFQRDRDRIIHSTAFRRLKHKTQVFVAHEGDHFRTRLTHTIEVAQVARTIAKALGLNAELTETVALAHDLGHPPFGHVGEDVLAEEMAEFGGFDHNAQAVKIVTQLERNYADFDGLNLTWESLEGIAKHNGPVTGDVPYALAQFNAEYDLDLGTFASAEAQVAALSDDIAYNNHDLDDGLRSDFFSLDELIELPILTDCVKEVDHRYPDLDPRKRRHEALRRVFGVMVEDVISESHLRLDGKRSVDDIRGANVQSVAFSDALLDKLNVIRGFLYENMYRHDQVIETRETCKKILHGLFNAYLNEPNLLPDAWQIDTTTDTARARQICDYLSGMTDLYAEKQYSALGLDGSVAT